MTIGPSSVKVKNEWSYTSIPPCVFMVCTGTILPFTFGHDDRKCPCYFPLLVTQRGCKVITGCCCFWQVFVHGNNLTFSGTESLLGTDGSGLCLGRDQFSPFLIAAVWESHNSCPSFFDTKMWRCSLVLPCTFWL